MQTKNTAMITPKKRKAKLKFRQSQMSGLARSLNLLSRGNNPTYQVIAEKLKSYFEWNELTDKQALTKYFKEMPEITDCPPIKKEARVVQPKTDLQDYSHPLLGKSEYIDFFSSAAWKQLRYQALKEYGAVCQCCGAKAGNGVQIHVDHIKPRSRYPELELCLSNTQILCGYCNHGKGAWDATDWRK